MDTCITLLRHGSTDNNLKHLYSGSNDLPLNEVGKKEVRDTAEKMKERHFDVLLYGEKQRVAQTARIVLEALVRRPEIVLQAGAVREVDFGVMEGLTYTQINERYPKEWEEYMNHWQTYTFPGGDNIPQYYSHCEEFIRGAVKDYEGKRLLIVGHKGFHLACAAALLGGGIDGMFDRSIENGGVIELRV